MHASAGEVPQSAHRPAMFNEAPLPEGFPPPGPVAEIIIKKYPAYRVARVRDADGNANGMFRPLFNHIQRNDIPMTAPVEMGYGDAADPGAASMAFLYGTPSWGVPGRDADDQRVLVEDVPPMTVASLGVRGAYSDAHFEAALERLQTWIEQHSDRLELAGTPRYLAYNSPFVPGFLKFGEVQLPIVIRASDREQVHP